MCSSEIMGSRYSQQQAAAANSNVNILPSCKHFQFRHSYAIIQPYQRKESEDGDRYGRIPDSRRSCKAPQKVRGQHHSIASTEQATGLQSRRRMDCEPQRPRGVLSQAAKCQTGRQIKKASIGSWHEIENLVAVSSSASVFQAVANEPRDSVPIFSIHRLLLDGKVLCNKMGTR